MSDQSTADVTSAGVSPLRRRISTAILLVLVVVLVIELRAGAGYAMSGSALEAASTKGVFQDTLLSDVEALIRFAPSRTLVRESSTEVEYRYSWNSLLRPLLQRPKAEYFVVVTRNATPAYALIYNTDPPTQFSIDAGQRTLEPVTEVEVSDVISVPEEGPDVSTEPAE